MGEWGETIKEKKRDLLWLLAQSERQHKSAVCAYGCPLTLTLPPRLRNRERKREMTGPAARGKMAGKAADEKRESKKKKS